MFRWHPAARRLAAMLSLVLVAAAAAGCRGPATRASGDAPCSFGGLVLVPVVCVRDEPQPGPDGTWAFPASAARIGDVHAGSILVVAGKSVRRVVSAVKSGNQVRLATAAVPLTEVIKDGRIPLDSTVTPAKVQQKADVPAPPPPMEPRRAAPTPATHPPVPPGTTPAATPPSQLIEASVRPVVTPSGTCDGFPENPLEEFAATISVSAGPVTVAYHWTLTNYQGSSVSVPGTVTFQGTGSQAQTVYVYPAVNQYTGPGNAPGEVTLSVDSPVTVTAPERFEIRGGCNLLSGTGETRDGSGSGAGTGPAVTSPSPSPSTSSSVSLKAYRVASGLTVNGYQVSPSLTIKDGTFGIDVTATRQVGAAELTWRMHGELGSFLSSGYLRVGGHRLHDSTFSASGLHGQVRLDWSLSAAVPDSVASHLTLDLPVRLFVLPLPAGDFPVFLTVEVRLHAGPEFSSGQALHGHALASFSGTQGLSVHLRAIDSPSGPSVGGLRLDPGIRDLVRAPAIKGSVDFPYVSMGDDLYSSGAWVWASPRLGFTVSPGRGPRACAFAQADESASTGIGFALFGRRSELSAQVFRRPLGRGISVPRDRTCTPY